jgi:hypothetical protein
MNTGGRQSTKVLYFQHFLASDGLPETLKKHLQGECRRFDPVSTHQNQRVVWLCALMQQPYAKPERLQFGREE